ncbi:GntR family transcriptional regulator [Nisaea sp.]|uniref:GntR family transcriptional regulator n=1 Tax=Nisaea sp. TaxID=2024842 RepID=UPI002B274A7C|nr:FCD domain-containing protein [Nisaea sp.]
MYIDTRQDRENPSVQAAESETTSITALAANRIRADILSGFLEPGRKLKISELSERYDVGATPVREALSLLTSDALVERIDQRGFRVALVSKAEFGELLKTRCWLEERALSESIANGDQAWEEALVLAHHHLSRFPRSRGDDGFEANPEWEVRHKRFHIALISACGSSILLRYCEQLYDQNIRYRMIAGTSAYPSRHISEEHEAILNASLDRNVDEAVLLLINHYEKTGRFLEERLSRGE